MARRPGEAFPNHWPSYPDQKQDLFEIMDDRYTPNTSGGPDWEPPSHWDSTDLAKPLPSLSPNAHTHHFSDQETFTDMSLGRDSGQLRRQVGGLEIVREKPIERPKRSLLRRFLSIYGKDATEMGEPEGIDNAVISYPQGFRFFAILLSGALPYIVVVLDDTVVAIILPILISQFHRPGDIGWYASAYFLPLTVLMPLFGKCYSLWKVKWLFVSALVILIAGSVLSAAAQSSVMFILGRAVAGAGASGIITGAMRIISLAAPRDKRTYLEAAGAAIMGACTMSGPILGGVIADSIGWRWSFWINAPIAFFSIVTILVFFPKESTRSTLLGFPLLEKIKRLDLIGTALLVGGIICLSSALQNLSTSITFSWEARLLVIASGVLLGIFLLHARFVNHKISLIPREIFGVRTVWTSCFGLFFLFAGFINYIFFLSIYFQGVRGRSPESSAISLLPYVLAVSVAAATTGIAVSKVRYYNPFFIAGGIFFFAGAALIFTFAVNTPERIMIGYEIVLGFGVGFLMLANVAPCQTSLREEHHSVAQGLLLLFSLLGSTISISVSSTIFNRTLSNTILALDQISFELKVLILADPTKAHAVVPIEILPIVLDTLMTSIRKTFLFGLGCSVMCAMAFFLLPWVPLVESKEARRASRIIFASQGGALEAS